MSYLRFSLRTLGRSPMLVLVVVLSLGLGIGANTAIFSLLYQMVLKKLPVEKPEELVLIKSPAEFKSGRTSTNNAGQHDSIFNYRTFRELEKRPEGLTGIAGFRALAANLSFRGQTVDGSVMVVSGGYFDTLRVKPVVGRLVEREDDVHGAGRPVAVLAHNYWQSQLGGRRDVLNQPIRVNGHLFTVVGIAPYGFTGTVLGDAPDVFVPMSFKPLMTPNWNGTDRWSDYWIYMAGRLKPGVTRQAAEAALNSTYAGLVEQALPEVKAWNAKRIERFRQSRLTLEPGEKGQSSVRRSTETPLLILMAATGLVLLIAIANTANLLLARAAQRRKEVTIRAALGAGRGEIMGQLLTEALLLSLAGGAAGVLLASWTVSLFVMVLSNGRASEEITATLDWPVLLFAVGASLASGLLAGLYPAWEAGRRTLATTLRDEAGQVSGNLATANVRKALVCAQVMVSALLLIPTGLFLKSLVNLLQVDLGLRTENVYTFRISPELSGYKPAQSKLLFERVEAEVGAIPGVAGVTGSLVPLIAGSTWGNDLNVEGAPADQNFERNSRFNVVGAGYFGKMGIPLVAGREFTESDNAAGPKVAVVSEKFVKHFFGDRNALGRKFGLGGEKPDTEIVGVVRDSKYASVKEEDPIVYYLPWRQSAEIGSLAFYVRSALPAEQVIPQIRRAMKNLDADLPLEDLRTLDEQVRINIRSDRMVLNLAGSFAVLATALAMLGLYGVMAYSVTRRTREIGIRLALGAPLGSIRAMVLNETMFILGAGLLVGVPAAVALAKLVESQLFGVKSFDPWVVAGAVAALCLSALLAGFLPARRAARIQPTTALRYE
ncbi:MAG: ABC transporter permease [Bryobacteraceae bacterium]|nr:ABC transporter permease [Bryobacteraceae bacterium]